MAASGGPPPLPPPPATPLARIPLPLVQGTLFRYGSAAANVAFMSGRHPRHVVLVGGLTDGLLFAGYCHPLAARLHAAGWSLVQALLSSCHTGYGLASLDQDADELHQLATHLRAEWGSQGMVIVGHSTGCQDAVRYAQRHRSSSAAAPLRGVVLQAPVSDVEWLATQAGTEERVAAARRMAAEGRGEEVAFRAFDIDGAAVTARRWLSLAAPGGDDDMFSSSLSDAQLAAVLGPLRGLPALVLLSGEEEYLPPGLDYLAVGRRLVQAVGPSGRLEVVQGATHALDGKEEEGAAVIADFVAAL
ncbi:hypothetical protein CHLNCDRAFT_140723 [Chlorella variabilis]|uniref:AB hydrolase-1 domain-containing protein n=1 Tax=Chlorella variabilis TaxID=554065 RepID=E1Z620_CHLVA|nr:hypothetical protein CHLNCDRAFT_140723 [Chlorella variabilis]EFN58570.1 hypothetical protein CHLNCDRAFT_140723 [Chlorella variabilis]|eukprot:XP_005850672.1 hypothetical protein CHLNCDRAFT_140723 [Chlorella variabilis]